MIPISQILYFPSFEYRFNSLNQILKIQYLIKLMMEISDNW